jgi:hypothetical protein
MDLMGLRSLIIVHAVVFFLKWRLAQPNNIHGSLSLCPLYPSPLSDLEGSPHEIGVRTPTLLKVVLAVIHVADVVDGGRHLIQGLL